MAWLFARFAKRAHPGRWAGADDRAVLARHLRAVAIGALWGAHARRVGRLSRIPNRYGRFGPTLHVHVAGCSLCARTSITQLAPVWSRFEQALRRAAGHAIVITSFLPAAPRPICNMAPRMLHTPHTVLTRRRHLKEAPSTNPLMRSAVSGQPSTSAPSAGEVGLGRYRAHQSSKGLQPSMIEGVRWWVTSISRIRLHAN